jgi:hypothetical protein
VKEAVQAAARGDEALAERVLVGLGPSASPELLAAVLAALDPGGGRPPDLERLDRLLQRVDSPPPLPARPDGRDQSSCRDIDPAALGRLVAAAVDPTASRPLVVDRVLSTLPAIKDLRPPALEPELDLPLWSFLKDNAPDWLLPGVGRLPMHSVVALATNPPFVQALLLGANDQTGAEMRWRRHPLKAKASPLRKFWQRAGDQFDINPIKGWKAGDPLGGPSITYPGAGEQAVVVFRTPLFKRYPHTAVYMYPAGVPAWDESNLPSLDPGQCAHPIFTGTIGDDVVFFGFGLPATAFADHWIVLEEPPAGYRFYNAEPAGDGVGDDPSALWPHRDSAEHAGLYAYDSFALPVRVMIGKLLQGNG